MQAYTKLNSGCLVIKSVTIESFGHFAWHAKYFCHAKNE